MYTPIIARDDANAFWRDNPLVGETIDQLRSSFAGLMTTFEGPRGVVSDEIWIAGQRALRFSPEQGVRRPGTILYLHGGAFLMGSPETAGALTAELVTRCGLEAVSPEYRLAPENPFPAALDDAIAVYRELLERGVSPRSIAFVGDSAGGNLAIITALAARDAGLPVPAAVVAFSAGADATFSGESLISKAAQDPVLTPELIAMTTQMYRGGADPNHPLLSPAVAADFRGMPPLLLQVGTNEIVLDDSIRMASRAAHADVDVILDVSANLPHVFQSFARELKEAQSALDRAADFISQHVE